MKPRYLLAILSGMLIGTSYIPFPPWAIFFCFVPLWSVWLAENSGENSYRRIFWTGWITQFVLTLIGFNWVSYTVHEFGHLPWPVAILTLLLFCAFANLYIPLAGVAWAYVSRKLQLSEGGKIACLAVALSVGERVFPMIFDWHFGYTWLYAGFPAYHLADIVGFVGLSNVGLAFNAMILFAWRRRSWIPAAAVLGIFAAMNLAGWMRSQQVAPPDAMAKFMIVQANIGNQEKLAAEKGSSFRTVVIERYIQTTRRGLAEVGPVDFVVWPETAFPELISDPDMNYGYPRLLKQYLVEMNTKLITGGYSAHESTRQVTNSFFAINEKGQWITRPYHKTVLLAFGEYFPGGGLIPKAWKDKYIPEVGDFGRGPGPSVLDVGSGLRVGAQICYEGLFDWFTRRLALQGANVMVNLTNDSWYGKWMQPYQHLYMTLARAIEVRRPLVRSTNTGISTVVLASGQILEVSPLHQEWFSLYEVPYVASPGETPFMGWGYYLVPALLALTLLIATLKGNFGRANEKPGLG